MIPVTKTVHHHVDLETWTRGHDIERHIPGVDIEVSWKAGFAEQARDAFDRAVAQIRAQIVDAEEPTK